MICKKKVALECYIYELIILTTFLHLILSLVVVGLQTYTIAKQPRHHCVNAKLSLHGCNTYNPQPTDQLVPYPSAHPLYAFFL